MSRTRARSYDPIEVKQRTCQDPRQPTRAAPLMRGIWISLPIALLIDAALAYLVYVLIS